MMHALKGKVKGQRSPMLVSNAFKSLLGLQIHEKSAHHNFRSFYWLRLAESRDVVNDYHKLMNISGTLADHDYSASGLSSTNKLIC